jgi:hypothetical protein
MNTTTTPAPPALSKKEQGVIRQRKYRLRLKEGAIIEGSNNDLAKYKATNTEYMKKYRASKKPFENVEIDINIPLVKKNINTDTIKKPNIKIKVSPLWKSSNNPNIETSTKLKGYTPDAIDKMIKKINIVMVKVLNITPSPDLLRVIKTLLLGHDIRGDIKYIKKEMAFISLANILSFANNIRSKYPNNNSFKTYILPFVNILARLTEGYNKEYQILTKIASDSNDEYVKIRNDNEITETDAKKLIDFNPDKIKEKLNGIDDINEKFLFSLYALLIPRRLEWANVKIMNDDNDKDNILIIDDKNPRFIFNNYKTASSFGKQEVANLPNDFIIILNEYIKYNDLKNGDYIFKSSKSDKHITQGTFSDKLSFIFSKVYKNNVSLRFIRMSFATYKNSLNLSNNEIKDIAEKMGHSKEVHSQYIKKFITN